NPLSAPLFAGGECREVLMMYVGHVTLDVALIVSVAQEESAYTEQGAARRLGDPVRAALNLQKLLESGTQCTAQHTVHHVRRAPCLQSVQMNYASLNLFSPTRQGPILLCPFDGGRPIRISKESLRCRAGVPNPIEPILDPVPH